jgi:hypothetical protein
MNKLSSIALFAAAFAHHDINPMVVPEPRLGDGNICHSFLTGTRRESCFAPEDNNGGGGGGGVGNDPPKTFTQEQLDAIVGKRIGEATKKYGDYEEAKAKAAKLAEIETELQKLRDEKEIAGKSAEEKATIAARKASEQMERERTELTTQRDTEKSLRETSEKKYRDLVVSNGLGSALDGAKVLGSARDKAIKAMRDDSKVELDEDGKITAVTYGGVAYKTAAEAATAFLKDNDFFAAGTGGGGGGKRPNAGGTGGRNLFDMSSDELLAASKV